MGETRRALRDDADELWGAIRRHRIASVYHWTHALSVASILAVGIRPRRDLLKHALPFWPHSYGLDASIAEQKAREFGRHVAIAFEPYEAMYAGYPDAVVLRLTSRVLLAKDVFFSRLNTANRHVRFAEVSRRKSLADFEALFPAPGAVMPSKGAEAWVPIGISPLDIREIRFLRREHYERRREELDRELAQLPSRPLLVVPPQDSSDRP